MHCHARHLNILSITRDEYLISLVKIIKVAVVNLNLKAFYCFKYQSKGLLVIMSQTEELSKILVHIDGSENAFRAADFGIGMAKKYRS
jgi:hypothetical protein